MKRASTKACWLLYKKGRQGKNIYIFVKYICLPKEIIEGNVELMKEFFEISH